jgi:hypothetical protein
MQVSTLKVYFINSQGFSCLGLLFHYLKTSFAFLVRILGLDLQNISCIGVPYHELDHNFKSIFSSSKGFSCFDILLVYSNTSYVFLVRIMSRDLQNITLIGVPYHECGSQLYLLQRIILICFLILSMSS